MKSIKSNYKRADEICQKWHVPRDVELHMKRVAYLVQLLATAMAINQSEIEKLLYAAVLHDIGKGLVPLEILNKPGRLSADEFEEMKKHVVYSVAILKIECVEDHIISYVEKHHERKNGSGYPNKINDISICDEILSICDIFDALVSDRPYRCAKSYSEAWTIINKQNFDKRLLDVFYKTVVYNPEKIAQNTRALSQQNVSKHTS